MEKVEENEVDELKVDKVEDELEYMDVDYDDDDDDDMEL